MANAQAKITLLILNTPFITIVVITGKYLDTDPTDTGIRRMTKYLKLCNSRRASLTPMCYGREDN